LTTKGCRKPAEGFVSKFWAAAGPPNTPTEKLNIERVLRYFFLLTKHLIQSFMKYNLNPLNLGRLTNSEVAELGTRTIADYGSQPPMPGPRADTTIVQAYIEGITQRSQVFDKAINRIQKDVNTQQVEESDLARDNAVSSLFKAIRVGLTSDVPAEITAAQRLSIVADAYRNITRQNYEAETKMLDTLVAELEGGTYAASVAALNLQRYVTRIKTANNNFKALFTSRITTSALTESFDTKSLRLDLLDYYTEYVRYLVAMANATGDSFFVQQLSFVNAARKYYNDNYTNRPKEPTPTPQPTTANPEAN